jgi:Family of unknown function (DUF5684)
MISLINVVPFLFLAQETPEYQTPQVSPVIWICYSVVLILVIASWWKMFTKAGQPGWAAIIPILNLYFFCKVAGRPGWWLILMLIPLVNFIIIIILCLDIAKAFGKGVGFGIGLIFLPFIFYPILAFGSAQYQGGAPAVPV